MPQPTRPPPAALGDADVHQLQLVWPVRICLRAGRTDSTSSVGAFWGCWFSGAGWPTLLPVLAIDFTLLGKGTHLVVVAAVVATFLVIADRRLVATAAEHPVRRRRRLSLLALVMLFGGAFRLLALDTTGRQITSGACLVIAAAFSSSALRSSDLRRLVSQPGPAKWMALYALAAVPSIFVASDPLAAAGGAGGLLALVLVAIAVGSNFDQRSILRLLGFLAEAALVVAVSSVALTPGASSQSIRSPLLGYRFVGWLPFVELGWGHLGVGFVVIGLVSARWRTASISAGLLLIVATQARGAAIAVILVVLVWIASERRRWLPLAAALLAGGALVAIVVDPVRNVWDREQAIAESDSLFTYRADFVRAAAAVAAESPLIGKGIDSGTVDDFSAELTIGRSDLVTSTHMAWTSALAGTGAIGLGLLFVTVASGWRWAYRCRTERERWSANRTLALLTMTWVSASSLFVVGPAELSAQGIVFGVAVVSLSLADQHPDLIPGRQPA